MTTTSSEGPRYHMAFLWLICLIAAIPLSWYCSREEPTEANPNALAVTAPIVAESSDNDVPTYVEHKVPPEPIGGYEAIRMNLYYPEIAQRAGIEGIVIVWAKVGTDGTIQNTKIEKSLGPNGCDEAAVNAIKSVRWKPALDDAGNPVTVWLMVPMEFRITPPEN